MSRLGQEYGLMPVFTFWLCCVRTFLSQTYSLPFCFSGRFAPPPPAANLVSHQRKPNLCCIHCNGMAGVVVGTARRDDSTAVCVRSITDEK